MVVSFVWPTFGFPNSAWTHCSQESISINLHLKMMSFCCFCEALYCSGSFVLYLSVSHSISVLRLSLRIFCLCCVDPREMTVRKNSMLYLWGRITLSLLKRLWIFPILNEQIINVCDVKELFEIEVHCKRTMLVLHVFFHPSKDERTVNLPLTQSLWNCILPNQP